MPRALVMIVKRTLRGDQGPTQDLPRIRKAKRQQARHEGKKSRRGVFRLRPGMTGVRAATRGN